MAMEQGLYEQVFRLRRKNLMITEANNNKNEDKFKFQGQYERSQRWFNLDFDFIEVNFSKCEPFFYRKLFQRHDNTQDTNTFKIFAVSIVNSKCVESIKFHSNAPMLKYCQNPLNHCCFGSLVSTFASIEQTKSSNDILLRIEESFKS